MGRPPAELLWDGKNNNGRFIAAAEQEFLWRLLLQIDGSTYLVNELKTKIVPSPPDVATPISGRVFALLPEAPQAPAAIQQTTAQTSPLQMDAELMSMLEDED